MATKSRLGKGLGALFPALPGDPQAEADGKAKEQETKIAPAKIQKTSGLDAASNQAKQTINNAASNTSRNARKSKNADEKSEKASIESSQQELDIKVSRETSKSHKKKRVSVPGFEAIAHPSDFFFGDGRMDAQGEAQRRMEQASKVGEQASNAKKLVQTQQADKDIQKAATKAQQDSRSSSEDKQSEEIELKPVQGGYLAELSVKDIGPNLHQPRTIFDADELKELSASIQEVGVLQPIVVRKRPNYSAPAAPSLADTSVIESGTHEGSVADDIVADKSGDSVKSSDKKADSAKTAHEDTPYELIMGERRWRAAQLAGMETIPAIVKTTADDDMLRDALLENLHRVALNPLEEAAAYQQMIDEFGLTQAQLSKSISKSRPQIANTLRLMNLPIAVQKKVAAGVLSAGHARALLGLVSEDEMNKLANRIIAEGLSVRSTEEIVSMKALEGDQPKKQRVKRNDPWAGSPLQQHLENRFDTKVSIKGTPKHGRIEIVFSSPEDMDRIMKLLVPEQKATPGSEWV